MSGLMSLKSLKAKLLQRKHIHKAAAATTGLLLAATVYIVQVSADTGRYYIDFGEHRTTSTAGWNNISGAQAKNTTNQLSLVDSSGAASSVKLRFTDAFNCAPKGSSVNSAGTTTSSLYPANATVDSLYLGPAGGGGCTQADLTAGFQLSGLAANSTYEIKFYASRIGDTVNRTSNYTIGTQTVSLNASGNVNSAATITATSSSTGTIQVNVSRNSASTSFAYLGVVDILRKSSAAAPPTASAGPDQSVTLPEHMVTLNGSGTVGGTGTGSITSYVWSEVSTNGATIVSPNSASTTITDLAPGTYTFRLTINTSANTSASDNVTVTVAPQNTSACAPSKIAVLGSSTAAGTGASPISNSWVNRYDAYLKQLNPDNSLVNLAVSGYTTYHVLPTGYPTPFSKPPVDTAKNITAAIAARPSAIIVNLPSNDVNAGFTTQEIQANYQTIADAAAEADIPIWIATSQPRNLDQAGRTKLMTIRDWTQSTYGDKSLDFWSNIANPDGSVSALYDSGDGVHINNAGHQKLYSRVIGSNLLSTICQQVPTITTVSDQPVVSQTVNWTTSEATSSSVEYGTTTAYGTTTPVADTNPRVTNHSVTIPNLQVCTAYNYRVRSLNADGAEIISTNRTFKTLCSV